MTRPNNDESKYEVHECMAILLEDNPGMDEVEALSQAIREVRERQQ